MIIHESLFIFYDIVSPLLIKDKNNFPFFFFVSFSPFHRKIFDFS